jgi:hypothetical protein
VYQPAAGEKTGASNIGPSVASLDRLGGLVPSEEVFGEAAVAHDERRIARAIVPDQRLTSQLTSLNVRRFPTVVSRLPQPPMSVRDESDIAPARRRGLQSLKRDG